MKTKYLVFTLIIAFVLTTTASIEIIRFESRLFEKSTQFDAMNKSLYELNHKYTVVDTDSTINALQTDLSLLQKETGTLHKDWYRENIIIIISLCISSVILFIILNIGILYFKYAETYNFKTTIITAFKNKVYLILIIVFSVWFFIHSGNFWYFLF